MPLTIQDLDGIKLTSTSLKAAHEAFDWTMDRETVDAKREELRNSVYQLRRQVMDERYNLLEDVQQLRTVANSVEGTDAGRALSLRVLASKMERAAEAKLDQMNLLLDAEIAVGKAFVRSGVNSPTGGTDLLLSGTKS
jgi:hypothetical protein